MGTMKFIGRGAFAGALLAFALGATAQNAKHYRFAHDQQLNTGYSVAYDIFSAKLNKLSGGKMLVDQYPGAQLGQEPQLLQLVKAGDLDFAIVSSANTATISPQAGVMSLHFLFRSSEHVIKSLADQRVYEAIRDMIDQTTQGIHAIGLGTQGVRNLYGKKEIRNVADLKGLKVRVQATATEDTMFPAYGAQTVHMPFGSVYTSLQTGVVDFGENSINVYLVNKHYEVAPVIRSPSTRRTMPSSGSATGCGKASTPSSANGFWKRAATSPRRSRSARSSWRIRRWRRSARWA
jgi:TRAP-type C4-dicarboxylate transport system substrate-binding protein